MELLLEIQPDTLSHAAPSFRRYKALTPRSYRGVVNLSKRLRGIRVFHINSTAALGGGGVTELLRSQIPLERSLGIDSKWFIIQAEPNFYRITKKIHNLLQGKVGESLQRKEKELYLQTIREAARDFRELIAEERPDIIIIHDPQPLPLIECIPSTIPSILRLHIDLSKPHTETFEFLRPLIERYTRVIITSPVYRPAWLPKKKTVVSMPAIDPFVEKNQAMSRKNACNILQFFNVHTDQPIMSQVSRFDAWKDPLGVIHAYYIAKKKIPDLQLILVGIMFAADDPEAIDILTHVKKHASDPDIFVFAYPEDLRGVPNDVFINAIQSASDIILQKSLREGFGLTVTEAMWKGNAVIGGKTEGISLQIKNGHNGFLVSSPEEAAQAVVRLCNNKRLRTRIGTAAKKSVKEKFLFSRLIHDHLKLYSQFIKTRKPRYKVNTS